MGIDPEESEVHTQKILFIDSQAFGLAYLDEIRRDSIRYVFTHVVELEQALVCLRREPFDAILWCYSANCSDADVRRLVSLKPEDVFDSALSPPVISMLRDDDHEGVAQAVNHASMGFIFEAQLRSAHAATILGAVMRRVSHDQLLEGAQQQLVHTEKFAAMGLLAAEVAHEINNPASFVISNLSVMIGYIKSIGEFLALAREGVRTEAPELFKKLGVLSRHYEMDFIQEDLDELLRRNLHGMQRIHQIVQDLRFFLHDTHGEAGWINVERLLETTLNLVKYEAKFRAHFELDFCDDAEILSDANRLSQVFLNLMVNAIHAIEQGDVTGNQVTVMTRRDESHLRVIIRDTGVGMGERLMAQIFEPFFTTKDRGDGSGLGLSISRDIVQGLGGELTVRSEVGVGSEFTVRLPIRAAKFEREARLSGPHQAVVLESDPSDGESSDGESSASEPSDSDERGDL